MTRIIDWIIRLVVRRADERVSRRRYVLATTGQYHDRVVAREWLGR